MACIVWDGAEDDKGGGSVNVRIEARGVVSKGLAM